MSPAPARSTPTPPISKPRNVLLATLLGAVIGFITYWGGAAIAAYGDLSKAPLESLPGELLRPWGSFTIWEGLLVGAGALFGAMVARYRWQMAGLLSFVGLLSLIAGYVAYTLTVSIPNVPPSRRWLSFILLAAEGGGLALILVSSFYGLDTAMRRRWARSSNARAWDAEYRPRVAFEVPVYNEPLELVQQTILHLTRQDYPQDRFMVVVCDDSSDPRARADLWAFCVSAGVQYVNRPDRSGYKAGALNHATQRLPADVEFIAVIDADYWVHPDYLRSIVGYFVDPGLSFVQTPQDYRNVDESFLTRQYKRAETYFYHAIMPSRNEENAIIFCGTMGMLRRRALDDVGGFAEDQICEDAEVSVRLGARGWDSLYVDESYGRGLMPAVFDAYKKQFHRWAFGNVKILFSRGPMILRSSMGRRQKFDFLFSNLHWFDGLFITAIALVLLFLGISPWVGADAVTYHQHEIALIALVPLALLIDGILRLHLVLRGASTIRFRDSLLVHGMWLSIKWTNLNAVVKYMLGVRAPFVRTPKLSGGRLSRFGAAFRAIRITKVETLIGALLLGVGAATAARAPQAAQPFGTSLLAGWLALYALFFLCAPIYAYLSYRTLKPQSYPLLSTEPTRAAIPDNRADAPARAPHPRALTSLDPASPPLVQFLEPSD